jgi:hypothetical protein
LHDEPPLVWANDFDQFVFRGNLLIEEVEFFHKRSGTVIMADFVQNYPRENHALLMRFIQRLSGVIGRRRAF